MRGIPLHEASSSASFTIPIPDHQEIITQICLILWFYHNNKYDVNHEVHGIPLVYIHNTP